MDTQSEEGRPVQLVATVSKAVLSTFLVDLAKTEGFADVAANLKKVVIDDGVFAEPAIRAAMFPDAP